MSEPYASIRHWCKYQYKKRRRAILKAKIDRTDVDERVREKRLVTGGQRTFESRMAALRVQIERKV